MRFLVKAIILAVPPVLLASGGQAPPANHARPAARAVAPANRPANRITAPYGGRPYPVPPGALVGHPELQPHAAGYTGIRPGAYSNTGRYYYGSFNGDQGRRRDHDHDRNHDRGRGGYLPYAYYSAPFLPFFDYNDYDSEPPQDDSAAQSAAVQAQNAAVSANMLGDQVQRLSAEVDSLRNQPPAQPAVPAAPQAPYAPPAPQQIQEQAPSEPPITVVLKSGRKLQVHNYAVMGQTFWDFSIQPARRISVEKIDVPASVNASSANGAEFPQLPSSN